MRFIHSPRAPDGGVPFLESTFYSSAKGTHATHYSKRYHLFPKSINLSHRGSATGIPHSPNKLPALKQKPFDYTESPPRLKRMPTPPSNSNFATAPTYPLRLFQSSFLHTPTHCHTTNKYGIPHPQLHYTYRAIGQGKLLKLPK